MDWDMDGSSQTDDNNDEQKEYWICKKPITAARGLFFFKGDQIEFLKEEDNENKEGQKLVYYNDKDGVERKLNSEEFYRCFKKVKVKKKKVKKGKKEEEPKEDDGMFGGGGGGFF